MKYLGANFEHWKICEWAIPSIIAYADLHRDELAFYGKDFCADLTKEQIANELYNYGVSADYNIPATLDQLKRMPESKLRLTYNAIQCTHNLVDISRVKGKDLEIEDTDKYTYLLTYSFPCQDLSLAGKGAGLEKGSGTRSSLLWEVERILAECGENLPTVLLCENVTQVHGAGNEESFRKFQLRLEKLGYESYWNDMTAVDFGIPQTRNRTFMVSILNGNNGEKYNFKFPKKIPLKLRLKDLKVPESQVAEKYYLSDKMVDYISAKNDKWTGNNGGAIINKDLASTINTGEGTRRCDASNYVSDELPDNYDLQDNNKIQEEINLYNLGIKKYNRRTGVVLNPNGSMTTLLARNCGDNSMVVVDKNEKGLGNKNLIKTLENTNIDEVDFCNQDFLLIKNATKQGYLKAEEGDGIDISSRMESHRGTVQKGKAQTVTTMGGENIGVVVKRTIPNYTEKSLEKIKKNVIEDDVAGSLTATGMQSINHDGCQLIKVNLKRGYACEVKKEQEDTTDVDIIGNYSKSGYNQTSIVGKNGVAPTVTENHGQVTAIVVDKNAKG